MHHIDGFFNKLKGAFANRDNKKAVVIEACLRLSKAELKPSEIEFRGQIARLSCNPAAKSQIFMKKAAILSDLNQGQKIQPNLLDIK